MAFWRDLGPRQQDVAVVVQIGVRAAAAGPMPRPGTDHGRAGAMMVLGPQARGGRLLGRWPGLAMIHRRRGPIWRVTTDYRDVLAEVLTGIWG